MPHRLPSDSQSIVVGMNREGDVAHYLVDRTYDTHTIDQPYRRDPDLRSLVETAKRHRQLITSTILACLLAATIWTVLQTPTYVARATIEIAAPGRILKDLDLSLDETDVRAFETARQKLRSFDLARRVVAALELTERPGFLSVRRNASDADGNDNADASEAPAIQAVQDNLSAELLRNTRLIQVSFRHRDAQLSADVANQAARSYLDQTAEARNSASRQTHAFIGEQVAAAKLKLERSEKQLVEYARRTGITLTGDDASLISQNIADVNSALAKAIDERLVAERYDMQVREDLAAALPQVAASASVQQAKNRLIDLRATYREKGATLKPAYPEMRKLSAQIQGLQTQIDREIAAIGKGVQIQHRQAIEKEQALRTVLTDLEGKQSQFQSKKIDYTILKREVDSNRALYELLVGKLNEAGLGADMRASTAIIFDPARTPTIADNPKPAQDLLLGLMFGIVATACLIYCKERLANTFTGPEEVEQLLRLPVLAVLPRVADGQDFPPAEDQSPLAEAHRTLRTSLQFAGLGEQVNALLVTSSVAGEGKTMTVFNQAKAFAAVGRKVLVIDADLRNPNLHLIFGMEKASGLSDLLAADGPTNIWEVFRKTGVRGISMMSAGSVLKNSTDLLASRKVGVLLRYCAKHYDVVVIDAPPVEAGSDTLVLARQVGATLLVVGTNRVNRNQARQTLRRLQDVGADVIGITAIQAETLEAPQPQRVRPGVFPDPAPGPLGTQLSQLNSMA